MSTQGLHRHRATPRAPALAPTFVPAVWSLVLTVVVLGPMFTSPGYLLLRDAVSTPRSYLTDSALGLSDAAARAVPQDALLAWVTTVVDGGVAVTVLLTASLWAAGFGAARLVSVLLPGSGVPAQVTAVTVAIWNPYVGERLLQGHWSLLAGYAALPWAICAAVAVRRRAGGGWWALAFWLGVAGLTPTGVLLAGVTAVVVLAMPGGRVSRVGRLVGAAALTVAVSAPWLVATALSGGGTEADPAGVSAFAARAEPLLGTIGSVAGLGGIWNADAVPGSRTTPWALIGTVLLLLVVACGLPALWRRRRNPVIVALAVVAVVAVLGTTLGATAPGLRFGEWAMVNVPGAGLLRDTQKWVALLMPLYVLAAAAGVGALRQHFTPDRARSDIAWAALSVVAVVGALPDLAWGVGGQVRPVRYPEGWQQVASIVTAGEGDAAVLPTGMFRRFDYSGPVAVLDPAPRMLRADVLQTGTLIVEGGAVEGEGARAVDVERLLLDGSDPSELTARGVGWVVVEHGTPGDHGRSEETLDMLTQVYSDDDLALYQVDGAWARETTGRNVAILAHLLLMLVVAAGATGMLATRLHTRVSELLRALAGRLRRDSRKQA
ncbi:hypothetical protein [Rhodococcus artemisiae]|uniref:Transmembrane protein n=1 Tax=Rhodococcus artemisiae TaxID=714159 RepID=A0ABU7L672_9NOCA|nr:hypothetical protein [Rhodococcus artemisiae]MEE2057051.1 hypothetical protein [Rhodococcus artemisiae]